MNANISLNADIDAIPERLQDALEAARIAWDEAYPIGCGKFQIERYGRAGTLKRELEAAGFIVTSAIDDRMDGERYCLVSFKEGGAS